MMLLSLAERMSSRKALSYVGASRNMLYYRKVARKRQTALDDCVASTVREIST